MRFLIPLVLFAVAADNTKAELEKLQGTWKVVSAVRGGKKQPEEAGKERKMTFKGDAVTLRDGNKEGQATCTLDPSKDPKTIDLVIKGEESKPIHGIYTLEGDDLKICAPTEPGKERPKDFAGGKDVTVIHLKREKT